MDYNKKLFVGGFLFFSMISGLLYWNASSEGHYDVDSPAYDRVARIFLKTGTMSDQGGAPAIHTQGYHFFIACVYFLWGTQLWKLIFLQILLAFLSVCLVARTAFLLFGIRCAQIVFVLALVDGAFYVYPQFMLAETLLLFLLTVFFERLASFYTTKKRWTLMEAGLVLGLSIIVKPTALFFPLGLGVVFLFFSLFMTLSVSWIDFFVFCSSAYLPVLLYIIRNGLTFGYYTFSFLMDFNLYCWFPSVVKSHLKGIVLQQALDETMQLTNSMYGQLEPEFWKPLKEPFYALMYAHPFLVLWLWLQNIAKTFFGLFSVQLHLLFDPAARGAVMPFFETSGSFVAKLYHYFLWAFRSPVVGFLMIFECVMNGCKWIVLVFGLENLYQKKSYEFLIFFITVVGCFSVVTGFFGAGRYRTTFEPLLLIVAAQGILKVYNFLKRYKANKLLKGNGL